MTDNKIPGIPTLYRGVQYRSRLEARWAAFFDEIGWWHTYEPFDARGYIPDFLIAGPRPLLIEVKPAVTSDDYRTLPGDWLTRLEGIWNHDVFVAGVTPLPGMGVEYFGNPYAPAGLLGERPPPEAGIGWDLDIGSWFHCLKCESVALMHPTQSWEGRPCGHHDGNSYLGPIFVDKIRTAWAAASNAVQWWKAE